MSIWQVESQLFLKSIKECPQSFWLPVFLTSWRIICILACRKKSNGPIESKSRFCFLSFHSPSGYDTAARQGQLPEHRILFHTISKLLQNSLNEALPRSLWFCFNTVSHQILKSPCAFKSDTSSSQSITTTPFLLLWSPFTRSFDVHF